MAGTIAGGQKAYLSVVKNFGHGFYKEIGSMGGKKSKGGGFASTKVGEDGLTGRERARLAGAKGGAVSRKVKAV